MDENTEAVGDRNPKGHRNLLSDTGIISGNKNKKLKESSTEKKNIKNPRPFSHYLLIWFGLLILTGLTVTVAGLSLGQLSVLGAIAIAAAKSTLVLLFFMHIKYEDKVFKIFLGLAIITLMIIMVLTFADVSFR